MTDIPEHMFNLGADAQYGPLGVTFVGRYMGKRYGTDTNTDTARGVQGAIDPFFTGDIKLQIRMASWVTASFSVNNLWDEKYFSSTAAERTVMFWRSDLQVLKGSVMDLNIALWVGGTLFSLGIFAVKTGRTQDMVRSAAKESQ